MSYQLYSIYELLALKDTGDRWIIKNAVPCPGRTLVHGFGSTYKSTVIFDLAVAVASKGALLEKWQVNRSGPVLVLSSEGDIYSNRDRLLMHMRPRDLGPDQVDLFYGQQPILVDTPEGQAQLEGLIQEVKPILLVIDPFVSFFSGDENTVREVKLFLNQALDPLIIKYELSCVLIHHSRKDGEIRGSTALFNWADSVLRFEVAPACNLPGLPEPVDVLTGKCTKQRNGKTGQLFSGVPFIDEDSGLISWGIYDDAQATGVAKVYLESAILKYLAQVGEPLTQSQIQEGMNVAAGRAKEAIERLLSVGILERTSVRRSTSKDGTRGRDVGAVQPRKAYTVDTVRALLSKKDPSAEDVALLPGAVQDYPFRVPAGISKVRIPTDE